MCGIAACLVSLSSVHTQHAQSRSRARLCAPLCRECLQPERRAASGSASEQTSRAFSALMGIELILAEFIPIYGLSTSCRELGG